MRMNNVIEQFDREICRYTWAIDSLLDSDFALILAYSRLRHLASIQKE